MRATFVLLPFLIAGRMLAAEPAAGAPDSTMFAYERSADFAVEEKGTEIRGGAVVRDLTFFTVAHPKFGNVPAYLVRPQEHEPRAAILWVHWLGDPATTNRTQFLDEAIDLAARGAVSLLIEGMWARPNWYRDRVLANDFEDSVAQVVALRRALDFLQQQPGAAHVPLGIVGHDYGGMYAIIAAAAEPRARTAVFIACAPSLLDWAFFLQQPPSMDDYLREHAGLELRTHVARIRGASLLFQFAEHDRYVPLASALDLFAPASNPKQLAIYGGADHSMNAPENIRADRTAWLRRELGLQSNAPVVAPSSQQ